MNTTVTYILAGVFFLLAMVLGFLGLVFTIGAQGQTGRIIVGIVLLLAAAGLLGAIGVVFYLKQVQPRETTLVQKIDLSGDVNLQRMKCRSCGAALSERSVSVQAGAVFVNCEYCGASYQIEEEVKW